MTRTTTESYNMKPLVTDTPDVWIATATQALVDELLSMNTRNRTKKQGNIDRLTADMERGKFALTASGVGVSTTGVLLDGQNRLMANRASGYPPIKFVIATGLDDSSQMLVDRHTKRGLSDALTMHMNMAISTGMVALANALFAYSVTRRPPAAFVFSRGSLPDSVAADFMVAHGDLAGEIVRTSGSVRAPVMAALFVYALHRKEEALEFARDVAKGINISEDSPAYRLRLAIDRLKTASDGAGRMELLKVAVSACIAHSNGRNLKNLRSSDSWREARWRWAINGDDIFTQE